VKIAGEMISLPFIEGILLKKYGSETELTMAIEAREQNGEVKIVLFSVAPIVLEEVQRYLRESGVSNLVKIAEVQVVEMIPVLGTGEIDYKVLKDMIE
jgi:long-chain-fatty-acid--[acyl-carrier-protein] ligase